VPHLWPSRVKVFFLGLLTSVFIFSVFQYLHSANVEYLNLGSPAYEGIVCKLPRAECLNDTDPVACMVEFTDRRFWRGLNLSSPCPALPDSLEGQTCLNPSLPLASIMGDKGALHTVSNGLNPFKLWSVLFLILTSLLSASIVIHDLALLEDRLRPKILSIPKLRYAIPCLWDCMRIVQCRRRMLSLWGRNRCVWFFLLPFWTLFQAVLFMAVMYPFSLLVCLFVAPVRMSRIMVFLSGILCMLWSVVFVTVTALFRHTQLYAVLWSVSEPRLGISCVCWCEFPLSDSVVIRIVALGLGMCWHSLSLTLRALKGLRRGQWANMFSVLHAVPIEAFPIRWDRAMSSSSRLELGLLTHGAPPTPGACSGGGEDSFADGVGFDHRRTPVRWRREGEPVQSEPAFDPFCLMDEQPESAWTCALIVPVSMAAKGDSQELEQTQHLIWEPYTGNLDTEIGCCGFPLPPSRGSNAEAATNEGHDDDVDGDASGRTAEHDQDAPAEPPPCEALAIDSSAVAASASVASGNHRPAPQVVGSALPSSDG